MIPRFAAAALALLAVGCSQPSMERCETLDEPAAAQACRQEVLTRLGDEPGPIREAIAVCSDAEIRDLLRLELVVDDPELSLELCPQMEGEQARSWCTKLEGRTHLWRTGHHGEQRAASSDPGEDATVFATLDQASAAALAGRVEDAQGRCEELGQDAWRRECHYRVAEARAHLGQVGEAFAACSAAGGAQQLCLHHVAWIASEGLVDALPMDSTAQASVDRFASMLPGAANDSKAARRLDLNARAAAWHGIYAGSGRADPAAAHGASAEDLPLARGAFAWELVRLLGPQLGVRTLTNTAWWTWRGEQPPPLGEPSPQACWPARIAPRKNDEPSYGVPTLRHFLNGKRTFSDDPEADLLIAVVEACWSQGVGLERDELDLLLRHPDLAVRRTAAKHVGLAPEWYPDPLAVVDSADRYSQRLAVSTRSALEQGEIPRGIDYPSERPCPR